jgi:hypothetical protein
MVRALIVADGNYIRREKGIGAFVEHDRGELLHERFCLEMQIPHNGITMPEAQHADGIVVDATAEEGHSSPHAKGLCTDITRVQAGLMRGGKVFLDDLQ